MIKTLREANEKKYYVAQRTYDAYNIWVYSSSDGSHFEDEWYDDNCFTFGSRFVNAGNQKAYNMFKLAYGDDDTIPSFQDFLDYGGWGYTSDRLSNMTDDEQWEAYLNDIGYNYTSLYNEGKGKQVVEKIAELCKDRDYSEEENEEIGIAILNAYLGGDWKVTEIHGSNQGEWTNLCYNSSELSESAIDMIEMMYFETFDSYVVTDDMYTEEEIENGAYYTFSGGKHRFNSGMVCDVFDWDKTKEEIADRVGCSEDEIYIVDEY